MIRDNDFYQDQIDLAPEQKKAWTQLVRAINKCKKTNIYFYQCLSTLHGLNGDNVQDVGDEGIAGTYDHTRPQCMSNLYTPSVETACSFADDAHFVLLNDESWPIT